MGQTSILLEDIDTSEQIHRQLRSPQARDELAKIQSLSSILLVLGRARAALPAVAGVIDRIRLDAEFVVGRSDVEAFRVEDDLWDAYDAVRIAIVEQQLSS